MQPRQVAISPEKSQEHIHGLQLLKQADFRLCSLAGHGCKKIRENELGSGPINPI
jgi:hypothetical protein